MDMCEKIRMGIIILEAYKGEVEVRKVKNRDKCIIEYLIRESLIEVNNEDQDYIHYVPTQRGDAMCHSMVDRPLPTIKTIPTDWWVDDQDKPIVRV